ncbi:hypothetical protein NECAME_14594 [Necator americanus]|uniref:Uncharacterized protein n=1 Tax=Necator americanus TaxID=51031 RepID=W2SPB7_NECAM|nr:hypothetical protein NECAME_14594 [Necator americanus]ETN70711.1 hypothetical protein NECAME_14594 [Necator americanus]
MRAEFGTYQLQRALGVLKMEGLRPIKPEALPESWSDVSCYCQQKRLMLYRKDPMPTKPKQS